MNQKSFYSHWQWFTLDSVLRSLDTIMLTSWAPHSLLFPCKEGAGRSTYLCSCPLFVLNFSTWINQSTHSRPTFIIKYMDFIQMIEILCRGSRKLRRTVSSRPRNIDSLMLRISKHALVKMIDIWSRHRRKFFLQFSIVSAILGKT